MSSKSQKSPTEKKLIATVFFAFSVFLSSCAGGSSEDTDPTNPPSNNAAVLTITSEDDGIFEDGEIQTVTATAIDTEDGDISANIDWRSSIDGSLGTGASLEIQLSTGTHTITASVTDSDDLSVTSQISSSVNAPAYGDALLSWNPPTQNTDDSNLTDLSGFVIYYGQSSTNLDQTISITSANQTQYLIESLPTQTTFYFAITAVNSLGIESELSNVSSKFISG